MTSATSSHQQHGEAEAELHSGRRRWSSMLVAALASPALLFGGVSLADSVSRRALGAAFTASGFVGGMVGLLALFAGLCSPLATGAAWFLALRGSARGVFARFVIAILLVLATLSTAHFLIAYIVPMISGVRHYIATVAVGTSSPRNAALC
jgi:hypothetical protein